MAIHVYKGWVKIGETLYPIEADNVEITYDVDVPPNTTFSIEPQEYRSIAHSNYVAPEYMYKAPPLDLRPPEMSDDEAFEIMDSIRKEMR